MVKNAKMEKPFPQYLCPIHIRLSEKEIVKMFVSGLKPIHDTGGRNVRNET